MVRLRIHFLLLIVCTLFTVNRGFAVSATESFEKSKDKIQSASSFSADFSMKINGRSVKGTLYSKGKKFSIESNAVSNWYNGTDLYTYNPSDNETSVFRPNISELREVNPLLFLNSASDYKIVGSKKSTPGVETIVLLPRKTGSAIKSVTIELDSKNYLPKSIVVTQSSGSTISLTITNVKLNVKVDDIKFEYPKSKYPKAVITDLR